MLFIWGKEITVADYFGNFISLLHTVLSYSAKIGLCARTLSFLGKADISLKTTASF